MWLGLPDKPFAEYFRACQFSSCSPPQQRSNMAPALGKRKRRDQISDTETNRKSAADDSSASLQALFRQHFESTFEPLPCTFARPPLVHNIDDKSSDEELESDWDGFSELDEEHAETVHYATSAPSKADVSKDEFKTFMVRAQIVVIHQY